MTDSDDETFLIAALEQLEEKEKSLEINPNLLSTTDSYSKTFSHSINSINEVHFLPAKSVSLNKQVNFRANLLKSLKNYQTSNTQNLLSGNDALKRKLENDELENDGGMDIRKIFPSEKIVEFKRKEPQGTSDHNITLIHQSTNVKKRKFPGPAGLLPKMSQLPAKPSLIDLETSEFSKEVNNQTICSQTTAQDFASGPWKEMYMDLSLLIDVKKFFKNHNIKNLSRKNPLRSQASIRKVSCIALMVRSLDFSHQDATSMFCDQTGEIRGTISSDVIEKYGELISAGTVFVLKDATILSPPVFQSGVGILGQLKKHYLTITLNSIVTIYSPNDDDGCITKTKVLTLKNAEFEELLSTTDDDDDKRKELIENEENETRIAVFENIGPEKNKNSPTVMKYSGNNNFKSPYVNTNNKVLPNIIHQSTTRLTSKELNAATTTNKPVTNLSKKFSIYSSNSSSFKMPSNSTNSINFLNNKDKNTLKINNNVNNACNTKEKGLFTENNSSKTTKDVHVDSISDDELDTLLASIDTDTLL